MIRAFVLSSAELSPRTLRATDYDNEAKRSKFLTEAARMAARALEFTAQAERLKKKADALTPNRDYLVPTEIP